MLAIPSIEISGARTAEPQTGVGDADAPFLLDPRDVARRWAGYGFSRLHVVDHDAATGRRANADSILAVLADDVAHVQVAGGIASTETAERYLHAGAGHVVVGSRALRDEDWLRELAGEFPGEIMLALDVRDRSVSWSLKSGGARRASRNLLDLVDDLSRMNLELGGLLATLSGDHTILSSRTLALLEDLVEASPWVVHVSGGDNLRELRALAERGVAAAHVGRALASGAIDPRVVVDEFAE